MATSPLRCRPAASRSRRLSPRCQARGPPPSGCAAFPASNPGALPALLVGADRVGREIDAVRIAAFAPAMVSAGTFAAPPAQIAFTVAAGILRAPPVTLDAAAALVSADLKAEFATAWSLRSARSPMRAGDDAVAGSDPAVGFTVEGPLAALAGQYDTEPLAQFLTQRALEREQARVEALQSALLEKQRLSREVRYYASLQFERDNAAEIAAQGRGGSGRRGQAQGREEAKAKAASAGDARRKAEEQAKADAEADEAKAEEAAKAAERRNRRKAPRRPSAKSGSATQGRRGRTGHGRGRPRRRRPKRSARPTRKRRQGGRGSQAQG